MSRLSAVKFAVGPSLVFVSRFFFFQSFCSFCDTVVCALVLDTRKKFNVLQKVMKYFKLALASYKILRKIIKIFKPRELDFP